MDPPLQAYHMHPCRDKRKMERHNILFSPAEYRKEEKNAKIDLFSCIRRIFLDLWRVCGYNVGDCTKIAIRNSEVTIY